MSKIAEKVKDKLKDAKDTVVGSEDKHDTEETAYDSTKQYEANEPMSPAKIKEHEPTAIKREAHTGEGKGADSNTEEAV